MLDNLLSVIACDFADVISKLHVSCPVVETVSAPAPAAVVDPVSLSVALPSDPATPEPCRSAC